jgi:hypothetical protein
MLEMASGRQGVLVTRREGFCPARCYDEHRGRYVCGTLSTPQRIIFCGHDEESSAYCEDRWETQDWLNFVMRKD